MAKILSDWEYTQKTWITSLFQTVLKDEHLKYFGICSEFYLLYDIVHWMGFYFFGLQRNKGLTQKQRLEEVMGLQNYQRSSLTWNCLGHGIAWTVYAKFSIKHIYMLTSIRSNVYSSLQHFGQGPTH